jgi:Na+(H+)/acetate symporter ActP
VIGGTLGGAVGGILTSLLIGIAASQFSGGPPEPLPIALAVAISTIFIVLGMLWPEMKSDWWERIMTAIILAFATLVVVIPVSYLLQGPLKNLKEMFKESTTFVPGVLILGAICGLVAGLQAGISLFFYDRIRKP